MDCHARQRDLLFFAFLNSISCSNFLSKFLIFRMPMTENENLNFNKREATNISLALTRVHLNVRSPTNLKVIFYEQNHRQILCYSTL